MGKSATERGAILAFPGVEVSRFRPFAPGGEGAGPPELPPAPEVEGSLDGEYGAVFDRLSDRLQTGERIAASERINAPIRYAELLSRSPKQCLELIEGDTRFHSYLLAEMLLERSREACFDDPARACEAAELAVHIARRLDGGFYGTELKRGLELKAWAFLGNARRLQTDLRAAEEAFRHVDRLLLKLSPDAEERAEALSLKVSLLKDQNRFVEARELLDELVQYYTRTEDDHKLGKTLIKFGLVQGETGDIEGAIRSQLASLQLLRDCGDEYLASCALGNLARFLEDAGRSEEALKFLDQAGDWMARSGSLNHLARARWLEGRIAASLEQDERAEKAFKFAQKFFAERAIDVEAASACLDLAMLYARQNRNEELRELAAEMVPIFRRQGLDREVMAALILFQHAAERDIATLGLIQEIAAYLKRTQQSAQNSAEL